MALTREVELKLQRAKLIDYFDANHVAWKAAAQDAYDYTKNAFDGAAVRQDDIAKPLRSVVEIHAGLQKALDQKKLHQKYWVDHFNSLVIDRSWPTMKK